MRTFAAFAGSAAGTCVLVLALLYASDFLRPGTWANPTTAEVQGITSRGVPTRVPTPAPTVPAPTPTMVSTPTSVPTSVPTPEPTAVPPAPEDEGA